jgi:RNA polymerase sigma factor (sigma-70 family)
MANVADTVRMEAATLVSRPARPRVPGSRSDGVLAARIRAGDDGAFEALYDRYHRNLLAFCHHMLASREEAEDALQHTFLAAYRALRAGDDVIGVKPWLYTIARNRCVSVLRARRDAVALDDRAAATEGLAAAVERRADLRLLVRDVQRLAPDQRAALVLFELGDHSHEEIAAVLGVRREKVKALVFQAREALMGWRAAREAPCAHVREQLATLSGSALRRATIRRHVEQCSGCADYEAEVRRQRSALAIALPVVPAAGLKAAVLGSALGGSGLAAATGAGGTAGAAGGLAGLGTHGIAAKVLVVAALAGGAGATGYVAVDELQQGHRPPAPREQHASPGSGAARAAAPGGGHANAAAPSGPAALATLTTSSMTAAHEVKARRDRGRALGTKVPHGKAVAPGQLKAPGSPAQGKALGAAKVKAQRATTGRAKPPRHQVKTRPPKKHTVKHAAAKMPRTGTPAAHTAPGQSPAGPPGQTRKQTDPSAKTP